MEIDLKGQVAASAAEIYDQLFVPALFAQWAPRLCDELAIRPGMRVLDVACGSGVLALEAASRVTGSGRVVGLDCNEGMLAVARRKSSSIDWRFGRAEDIPAPDGDFDMVVSQFGLMFFEEKARALQEMARVLARGGSLGVAIWDAIENAPGYRALADLLDEIFGAGIGRELRAPFSLGDRRLLAGLFAESGLKGVDLRTLKGKAVFPSFDGWLATEIKGWTLAEMIDDEGFERLRRGARDRLGKFIGEDGGVSFAVQARIAIWRKP